MKKQKPFISEQEYQANPYDICSLISYLTPGPIDQ